MQPNKICMICKSNKVEAIHELSGGWLCHYCYKSRENEYKLTHRLLDWNNKATIDSLDEAMNYFTWLQANRNFSKLTKESTITGDKGNICHVIELVTEELDAFQIYWRKCYAYYVCYNREYLVGRAANMFFERAPKGWKDLRWQSIHSKIIDHALTHSGEHDGIRIVIIMPQKKVWYVEPFMMRKFAYEYETEHTLPRETEPTCSIPVNKLEEDNDPFYVLRQSQESSKNE